MPLHTIVGFVADFPIRDDGAEPAGKELAAFVHTRLTEAGFGTSAPENREEWAWDMCTRDGELGVETIVGLVDDTDASPPRQWLITNDCALPFFKRFFGKTEFLAKRETLLRSLCETIQSSMKGDSRFSHVSWYDQNTFDKPGDVPSDKP